MKKYEKLAYLILNHFDLFTETFLRAFNDLSEKQEVFCCCGRVTSYVHEVHCKKFAAEVENETIKQLSHLLPKDKNKPGFNVGDWIIDNCGYIWKIKRILNQVYILEGTEGAESRLTMDLVDDTFHLWTIQDAKDGDVISFYSEYKGNKIFQIGIIEKYVGKYGGCSNTFKIYIGVNWDNNFQVGKYMGCNVIHPATKVQRDALMKAMNDAGYEWNAEKKELKKLK